MVESDWIYLPDTKVLAVSVSVNTDLYDRHRKIIKDLFDITFQEGHGFNNDLYEKYVNDNADLNIIHRICMHAHTEDTHHKFFVGYKYEMDIPTVDVKQMYLFFDNILDITLHENAIDRVISKEKYDSVVSIYNKALKIKSDFTSILSEEGENNLDDIITLANTILENHKEGYGHYKNIKKQLSIKGKV